MKTKKRSTTKAKTKRPPREDCRATSLNNITCTCLTPRERVQAAENIAEWAKKQRDMLAALDVHQPSAHGVRPLFRMALTDPEATGLGYLLIDVIAVITGEREDDSKHTFPTYVCLALSAYDGKWKPTEVCGYEGACEFDEAYEVVS